MPSPRPWRPDAGITIHKALPFATSAAASLLLTVLSTSAADRGQWTNQDAATRDWFKGLHNDYGTSCCDFADGSRVDDPDWRQNEDGSYSVIWKGQWTQLDPKRILKGTNRVGYAILWGNPSVDQPYCFIPGTRS